MPKNATEKDIAKHQSDRAFYDLSGGENHLKYIATESKRAGKITAIDYFQKSTGISRYIEEQGIAFFALAKEQELEGIVAKKKDGLYHIGKRTSEWIKIKVMQDEDLLVCGFQPDEDGVPKDLILGYYEKDELKCRGKVYLGVSKEERAIILKFAKKNTVKRPWFEKYKNAVWLKPELIGTAHFMHETENGGMRQPVWKGLR